MKKYKIGYQGKSLTIEEVRDLLARDDYFPVDDRVVSFADGKAILDLGCNLGKFSCALAKRYPDAKIVGVDSADYMIETAKDLYSDMPGISFQCMDASTLKFDNEEFDCVCFLEVIEHVTRPWDVLKEINRIIKPGGSLILSTNNVFYLRFFFRQILTDFLKRKPKLMIHDASEEWNRHIFAWDVSTLCTLLNDCGFEYIKHFYTGSSGITLGNITAIDMMFAVLFPYFRSTVVVKFRKISV